jgi:hypothetical protein
MAGAALGALGNDKEHGWVEAIRLLGRIAATAAEAQSTEGDVGGTNVVRLPVQGKGKP